MLRIVMVDFGMTLETQWNGVSNVPRRSSRRGYYVINFDFDTAKFMADTTTAMACYQQRFHFVRVEFFSRHCVAHPLVVQWSSGILGRFSVGLCSLRLFPLACYHLKRLWFTAAIRRGEEPACGGSVLRNIVSDDPSRLLWDFAAEPRSNRFRTASG